ncbi:hypothetical protein RZR66_14950 [Citrobacter freundii]|uniref:Uncharacterized protein n=1 Tax=Salmonella enterica subsp. enterica serovar Reading TaxID=165302 RepID=A0A644RN11_SALET|nr:hypothetical protein [Citrobacter freundii]YP_010664098.1 hypothetical protein PQA63_gp37 [Salmonella phage BIS20]EAA6522773.1 hypothetical protein [Salmonella enterica subsp. enterica serovar Reading]EAR0856561.1 hypothetical protein [Salmonella enterica]EDQ6418264.1 hypothetical protein [Salmonella enterica subsp. enterica]EAA6650147.1 hypothetical protein [Salmonella enterica subsp. enterica serovar Reading]EAB8416515.1 hypothetical protein [Salmonella enterica subsp. enterica serovar R
MNLRFIWIVALCALMFALGFFFGGFNWEWAGGKHSNEVALWSMLGGWLSAFATLAAVLVSLYMAYQAVQNDTEKLRVMHGISGEVTHGKGMNCSITIQNMRNLKLNVTGVYFSLGNSSGRYSLEKAIDRRDLSMSYKGERLTVSFVIDSGVTWWGTFSLFETDKGIDFKKGKLFITTDLNTYESKLPTVYLTAFKDAYSRYRALK